LYPYNVSVKIFRKHSFKKNPLWDRDSSKTSSKDEVLIAHRRKDETTQDKCFRCNFRIYALFSKQYQLGDFVMGYVAMQLNPF
jgi:hypothetical protein